ncbi:hypothetical protein AYO47_07770 [Planctomyces sp. SCGC AG-212-M04]|nr:hypothetical protein AYO47_07770 [Planctomyces sp. SCGC AG-212-M04]
MSATANLQAYRPVTANINSLAFPISEADEESATRGAGIRVNGDDDNGVAGADYSNLAPTPLADNDLIRVEVAGEGELFTLTWAGSIAVWTSATKDAAIINGSSVFSGQTVWVEYTSQTHTVGTTTQLTLTTQDGTYFATDTVVFHSFQSVVLAIAGNTQSPSQFGDPNLGIYTIAGSLYAQGYDVQLYGYYEVSSSTGKGKAYDDTVSAVLTRNVNNVAIIGYSWGGGATYNLSNALKKTPTLAPAGYKLVYTAYIDGIRQGSVSSETRKPVGTLYHDNIYQRKDSFPRGNKVTGANLNLNVTITPWGALLRHVTIDDNPTVQQTIIDNLKAKVLLP